MTADADEERVLLAAGTLGLAVAATLLFLDRHALALAVAAGAVVAITTASRAPEDDPE